MKLCSVDGCGHKHRANGLCSNHHVAAWKAANPERTKASAKKHNQSQSRREACARYYKKNKDEIIRKHGAASLARTLKWAKENPERSKQIKRAWQLTHPEALKASVMNRRARIRGVGGKHTAAEVIALFHRQKGLCAICACDLPKNYHKDHIMPLALGGPNDIGNIQLTCPPCNYRKSATHPDVFMAARA